MMKIKKREDLELYLETYFNIYHSSKNEEEREGAMGVFFALKTFINSEKKIYKFEEHLGFYSALTNNCYEKAEYIKLINCIK